MRKLRVNVIGAVLLAVALTSAACAGSRNEGVETGGAAAPPASLNASGAEARSIAVWNQTCKTVSAVDVPNAKRADGVAADESYDAAAEWATASPSSRGAIGSAREFFDFYPQWKELSREQVDSLMPSREEPEVTIARAKPDSVATVSSRDDVLPPTASNEVTTPWSASRAEVAAAKEAARAGSQVHMGWFEKQGFQLLTFAEVAPDGSAWVYGACPQAAKAIALSGRSSELFEDLRSGRYSDAIAILEQPRGAPLGTLPTWESTPPRQRSLKDGSVEALKDLHSKPAKLSVPKSWLGQDLIVCPFVTDVGWGTCTRLKEATDAKGLSFALPYVLGRTVSVAVAPSLAAVGDQAVELVNVEAGTVNSANATTIEVKDTGSANSIGEIRSLAAAGPLATITTT